MARLSIELPDHSAPEDAGNNQSIRVTHLRVLELPLSQLEDCPASPGIVLLMPLERSFALVLNGRSVNFSPGSVHLLPGDVETIMASTTTAEAVSAGAVNIIELNALLNGSTPIRDTLAMPNQLEPIPGEEVARQFRDLYHDHEGLSLSGDSDDILQHMIVARLVTLLIQSFGKNRRVRGGPRADERLDELKRFLVTNLHHKVTLNDMAEHVLMSRASFCRWATPLLGVSPALYLRRLRLEKSQELLTDTSLSIDKIAEQTGFSCRYHLAKEFKKHYQITPAAHRKMNREKPETGLADRANSLMRQHRYEEALELCRQALAANVPEQDLARIRYLQANCMHAMGDDIAAQSIWEKLDEGNWSYLAGKQLCALHFTRAEYAPALAQIRKLWLSTGDERRMEISLLWKDQVSILIGRRDASPLPAYLALRLELFPDHEHTHPVAAEALAGIGKEGEIPKLFPGLRKRCFFAMRRTGDYRRAIEDYGDEMSAVQVKYTLLLAGQNEEVLAVDWGDDGIDAMALARLGRAEEAIGRYPAYCQEAYLHLGRYQDLLDRFPAPTGEHVKALWAMGNMEALKNFPTDDPASWHLAQCHVCPDKVSQATLPTGEEFHGRTQLSKLFHALRADDAREAGDLVEQLPVVDSRLWWHWSTPDWLIVAIVTRGLLGNEPQMKQDLVTIASKHRFVDWQLIWHDAAYLLGEIDEDTYRQQPCQRFVEQRLSLIQSMQDDLHGRHDQAKEGYRSHLALPLTIGSLFERRFASWRLQALE